MIRLASAADLDDIVHIERGAETAPHWSIEEYLRMVEAAPGPLRRVLLLAEGEGFAAGSALGAEAELESVVVRADARRKGLGRALCAAVMAWARSEGAAEIKLEVRSASTGARLLYRQLGFTDCGLRPAYYDQPQDDAVLMRCDLQQGD